MNCELCGCECDEFGDVNGAIVCGKCLGWYGDVPDPEGLSALETDASEDSPNIANHPAVIEHGENWVRFKSEGPDTLDEIVPESLILNRITRETEFNGLGSIWYVEWEKENHD